MSDLRYPIGAFEWSQPESEEQSAKDRVQYIEVLAKLPVQMRAAVQGLGAEQLDTPYRPEGWTRATGRASCAGKPHECVYPI